MPRRFGRVGSLPNPDHWWIPMVDSGGPTPPVPRRSDTGSPVAAPETRRARQGGPDAMGGSMAARKKAAAKRGAKAPAELIISKSRVKAATKKCNVGGDFYGALDGAVRKLIAAAEERATANKRKTLKPADL
jgi:hypothetical protein